MSSKHILCVEDDPDAQELVATILIHMRFRVDMVSTAEQALSLLANDHPPYDAIVMDLALPVQDGWMLLDQIRKNPQTRTLCCIVITAFHTSKLREMALRYGFDAYFAKPLDVCSFGRAIESLL